MGSRRWLTIAGVGYAFFELITFTVRVRTVADALARIEFGLAQPEVGGTLMGCWASELGKLNQIAVLRGYADENLRQTERERFLLAGDVFGIGAYITDLRIENYSLFPFLEPLSAGQHGPFYELRVYDLISSGLQPTLDGWRKAIEARTAEPYSPVYAAFTPPTARCRATCTSGPGRPLNSACKCAPKPSPTASGHRKTPARNCRTCARRFICRRSFRRCSEAAFSGVGSKTIQPVSRNRR